MFKICDDRFARQDQTFNNLFRWEIAHASCTRDVNFESMAGLAVGGELIVALPVIVRVLEQA
jgi:hypothetical protein